MKNKSNNTPSKDGSEQNLIWPLPSMMFSVSIDDIGKDMAFRMVSGLQKKFQVVEYRGSTSKKFLNVKMPLYTSSSDVVLKKGMFTGDTKMWNWLSEINLNTIKRRTVEIDLLDETGKTVFKWILTNAFPKEISFGELDSMKATYAVEELVIAHEGLTFGKG